MIHTFGFVVRISKASQEDPYTVWDDADANEKFKDKLLQLVSEVESNPLLCQNKDEFVEVVFQGFSFLNIGDAVCKYSINTRGHLGHCPEDLQDVWMCAYERQSVIAAAFLEKADVYLDLSVIEQKMLS